MTKCKNCGKEMKRYDEEYGLRYKYEYLVCPCCEAQAIVTYKKESEIQRTKEGTRLQKGDKKMVAWYWLIVAFLLGNAFATFTYEQFEWDNIWSSIVAFLALIVLYIPMAFYKIFLNNTIHPVSRERYERLKAEWLKDSKSKCFNLGKHFIFWIDPKATRLFNKIFFLRIIDKPIDKQPKVCYNKDKERG